MRNDKFAVSVITYPNSRFSIYLVQDKLRKLKIPLTVYQSDDATSDDVKSWTLFVYLFSFSRIRYRYLRYIGGEFNLSLELVLFCKSVCKLLISKVSRNQMKKSISRCVNISQNHVSAWKEACVNGIPFLIVLEDDAEVSNFSQALKAIKVILSEVPNGKSKFVLMDLSNSFSLFELGIDKWVNYSVQDKIMGNEVFYLNRLATNTLCGVLYGSQVLREIVTYMDEDGGTYARQGIPIDWILNDWISGKSNSKTEIVSIHVKPGFFRQLSME